MICPVCAADLVSALTLAGITVDQACGASLVVTDTAARRATMADLVRVSGGDMQQLRVARAVIVPRPPRA